MLIAPINSIKKRYVQPTLKGQVTLPVSIRRKLGIDPNTLLNVTVDQGRIIFEPVVNNPLEPERWETVVDFTQISSKGIKLADLQNRLSQWTKSKKRSKN